MAEEKKLPLPEKELPPPHDMQLGAGGGSKPPTSSFKKPAFMPNFWAKYGSKKWLLPLIILMVLLVAVVGAAAFMGSSEPMTRREKRMERQEKRMERQERRQNKNKKNNKNNNKRNNKNNKNKIARTNADASFTNFTYGSGTNKITMQYPGNMKVNITKGVSILDNTTEVPLITFTDNNTIMRMRIEPNANNLSAANWQTNLSKANDTYNTPTESLTVSGKPAAIQHTLSQTANWLAYVPMSGKMLVIDMNYGGGKNKAKDEIVAILKTIQIGETATQSIPTATTVPSPTGM